tara:strand:- start:8440 stop:9441 length:1002 start_codon:yes stop_codon:yes gene_type:complete
MINDHYLAIETSCDETCCAILDNKGNVLSNTVFSQADIHSEFGGVLPDVASKNHTEKITYVIDKSLKESGLALEEIKKVFVTNGPGLINCLMIGVTAAKTISLVNNIPIYPINHIEGHIASCFIESKITFPALCLVVSGGHTSLYILKNEINFQLIGNTIDDAAGEAFDKGAKILGLGYPGGVKIDQISRKGNSNFHKFPVANLGKDSLNFSFSGLKTSLKYFIEKNKDWIENKESIAASYQEAIVDSLIEKIFLANKIHKTSSILICGGVACNSRLRDKVIKKFSNNSKIVIPSLKYCTDNAAMIAMRGIQLKNSDNYEKGFGVFSSIKKLV